MPDVADLEDGLRLTPAHAHIEELEVRDAIQRRIYRALEAVVTYGATQSPEFTVGGLFRFVVSAVKGSKLESMPALNPREVVLPSVQVLLVLPGSDCPYAWQTAAIDPHGRSLVAVELAGEGKESGDRVVQFLIEAGISAGRIYGDTVCRIGEREVIHNAGANGLAEPTDNNATGLGPVFANRTEVVVTPTKTAV